MADQGLSLPIARLIDALARQAAADYLTAQTAEREDSALSRPNPVPLHPADRAA